LGYDLDGIMLSQTLSIFLDQWLLSLKCQDFIDFWFRIGRDSEWNKFEKQIGIQDLRDNEGLLWKRLFLGIGQLPGCDF